MEKLLQKVDQLTSNVGSLVEALTTCEPKPEPKVHSSNNIISYRSGNQPVELIGENDSRIRLYIRNESQADLLISYDERVGLNDYSERIEPGDTQKIECDVDRMYMGPVNAIFEDATSGQAVINEWYKSYE